MTVQIMSDREVTCGGRTFTIRVYPDGVIAVLERDGKLVAGWPITASLSGAEIATQTDGEICARLSRLLGRQG